MEGRSFGTSSLQVSPLGLGASLIGGKHVKEEDAGRLLNEALDLGVRLIDTGPAFGLSEERIGSHLAHRRDEFVLSTRCSPDDEAGTGWTPESVTRSIDDTLVRLKTEHLDLVLVPSLPADPLEAEEAVAAFHGVVQAGKVRVVGYAGDERDLEVALAREQLGAFELTVNVFDQDSLDTHVLPAARLGKGILARRPLANAPWLYEERPHNPLVEVYWDRMQAMGFQPGDLSWPELAIRFVAHHPGVSSAVFGTANVLQLARQIEWVEKGPLPGEVLETLRTAFQRLRLAGKA
ncbi:MAG: aldo/keto reductase [bacterium]|nr:aldo/keto reductase [bacterium]